MKTIEDLIKKAKQIMQTTGIEKIEFEFAGSNYKIESPSK